MGPRPRCDRREQPAGRPGRWRHCDAEERDSEPEILYLELKGLDRAARHRNTRRSSSVITSRPRDSARDRAARHARRSPRGVRQRGDRGCGGAHRPTRRFRASDVGLIDAQQLADQLGVARDWVYANAQRLGGVRLGDGPRARLRFDVELARRALASGPEDHAATEQRSDAAQAWTASTGGCTYRRAPHSRQVQPVITDRAILRCSAQDCPAGRVSPPSG